MKKFFLFSTFGFLALSLKAFANEIVPPGVDEFAALIAALGGLKGASALAIAAVVVQAIMLLLRSKLGEVAGKYRLLAVYLLSVVAGVVSLRIAGVDLGAALVHTQTLAAFQVFLNQVLKQFFEKTA